MYFTLLEILFFLSSMLTTGSILSLLILASQLAPAESYYFYRDRCDVACISIVSCFIIISCCFCTACVILYIGALSALVVKFAYSKGKRKGQSKVKQQQMYQPRYAPAPHYYPGYPHPVQTTNPVPMCQVQYPPPPVQ